MKRDKQFDKDKFKEIAAKHGIQIEYNSTEQGFKFCDSGKLYPLAEGISILRSTFM